MSVRQVTATSTVGSKARLLWPPAVKLLQVRPKSFGAALTALWLQEGDLVPRGLQPWISRKLNNAGLCDSQNLGVTCVEVIIMLVLSHRQSVCWGVLRGRENGALHAQVTA